MKFLLLRTVFKKSGTKIPNVDLEEIGPSFNFLVRRCKLSSDEIYKNSKKQPKEIQPKKKKNISRDAFGSTLGRIHMQKQDLGKLQLRKLKAFKKEPQTKKEDKTGVKNRRIKTKDSTVAAE